MIEAVDRTSFSMFDDWNIYVYDGAYIISYHIIWNAK
jgi:hypothetical protein